MRFVTARSSGLALKGVAVAILLAAIAPRAQATFMISASDFSANFTAIDSKLTANFTLKATNDGVVLSQVFKGNTGTGAAGMYAYVYQVTAPSDDTLTYLRPGASLSGATQIGGFGSLQNVIFTAGSNSYSGDSAYISSGNLTGFAAGTQAPDKIDESSPPRISINYTTNVLPDGNTGFAVVLFTNVAPYLGNSVVSDNGTAQVNPTYVTTPAPGSLTLLGMGFVGLMSFAGWRRWTAAPMAA